MSELYRPINDETEFRGKGYFNATVKRTGWFGKHHPGWSEKGFAQVFKGNRVIVRRLEYRRNWYELIGHVGGNVSVPSYATYKLFIHARHLTSVLPRHKLSTFEGLDKLVRTGYGDHE